MRYPIILTLVVVLFSSATCTSKKVTQTKQKATEDIQVRIVTPFGDMIAELHDETPLHRDNFMKLVDSTYFDSLLFHRVIQNFMVQGGDPKSKGAKEGTRLGMGGPGYTVPAEFTTQFVHQKGALSAARQGGPANPEKRSSGSQFYVVQGQVVDSLKLSTFLKQKQMKGAVDFTYTPAQYAAYGSVGGTPHLDGEYTVFGQVIEGLNVIDSIAAVKTDRNDRPVSDVIMRIERIN